METNHCITYILNPSPTKINFVTQFTKGGISNTPRRKRINYNSIKISTEQMLSYETENNYYEPNKMKLKNYVIFLKVFTLFMFSVLTDTEPHSVTCPVKIKPHFLEV